jgi:hypothetical protein
VAAPTISDDVSANFVSPGTGGSSVGNLTIGANTKLVVGVVGGSSSDPVDASGMTVGGVAMTQAFEASNGAIYYLEDPLGNGLTGAESCVIHFNSGGFRTAATFYALDHADPLVYRDDTNGSGFADNAPTLYTLPNMTADGTDALSVGFAYNNGFFTGNIVLGGDLVEDHDHNIASERVKTYHDTTTPLGGHAYANGTGGTMYMGMAMFGPAPDPDVTLTPSPFGVEAGFQSGVVFGPGADVALFPQAFGVEVGFTAGIAFGATGPRQVMLTGADLETPQMTEGGTEGYILTYHDGGPPTWEPGSGPGSLALDDLSDVDAPTPSDGDVLTFDSGTGDWVNAPPVTGGGVEVKEVDGAPDVNPTTILRFPNGSLTNDGGGQVTVAFPATDFAEAGDIGTLTFGAAASAGATGEVADGGHVHPMPADPVTAHVAAADPHTGYLLESLLDAKGDLIVATANDTPARLAVGGTNGHVLTVDSAEATGVKWAAAGGSSPTGGGGWLGDGSDGTHTLDGATAVTGCSRSGNDYTATRDLYFAALTVNSGKTLDMAGFVLHVRGTLTNSGTIYRKPVAATGTRTGATGFTAARTGMSGGGGTGPAATGNGSAGTNATTPSLGGAGGAGGASQGGGGGTGGAGGTASPGTTSVGHYWRTLPDAATGWSTLNAARYNGGAGGGGGGTNGVLGNGGGGGAGGGILIIRANAIDNSSGLIHADGGAGSNGADNVNDGGGGGGGGGGAVLLVYNTFTAGAGTVRAAGGAFGTSPAGTNGTAGSAGTVSYVDMTV